MVDEAWYSATKALELLEPFHGALTKAYIADKLRDGMMRSRASQMWQSDHPTLTEAWRDRDNADVEEDVDVSRSMWKSSRHWDFDTSMWSWPEERFLITRSMDPSDRTIISGLYLNSSDVDQLALQKIDKRYIRRRKKDEWELFWMSMLELSQNKKLNVGTFGSQASLLEEIQAMMNPNLKADSKPLLSDESLEPFIAMIWTRFIGPKG